MATQSELSRPAAATRRARYFFYALGGGFVALGFALEMAPPLAALVPAVAGRVSAGIGAIILSFGRFGPDGLVAHWGARLARGRL